SRRQPVAVSLDAATELGAAAPSRSGGSPESSSVGFAQPRSPCVDAWGVSLIGFSAVRWSSRRRKFWGESVGVCPRLFVLVHRRWRHKWRQTTPLELPKSLCSQT